MLTPLDTRRLSSNRIEVFELFEGFGIVESSTFFELSSAPIRGHTFNIIYAD